MPRKRGPTAETTRIKNSRIKNSSWFITVNPHHSSNGLSDEEKEKIENEYHRTVVDTINDNLNILIQFGKEGEGWSNVKEIENYTTVEIQPVNQTHGFHTHTLLSIEHNTRISLDYEKTKSLLKEACSKIEGSNKPNVHVKRAENRGANEKSYMEKKTGKIWSTQQVYEYYKENGKGFGAENPFQLVKESQRRD